MAENLKPIGPALEDDALVAAPLPPHMEQKVGQEYSAITGKEVPSDTKKIEQSADVAVPLARYAPPLAASGLSMSWPAIATSMAISFASELSALRLEQASSNPRVAEMMDDLETSGWVGGFEGAINTVTKGFGKFGRGVGRFLRTRKEIAPEAAVAMRMLERPGDAKQAALWDKWAGKFKGLSVTPYQLNPEERGLSYFLESLARGGLLSRGRMTKFGITNKEYITEAMMDYVSQIMNKKSGAETGRFLDSLVGHLGKDPVAGSMFKPVASYRAMLYRRFEDALPHYHDVTTNFSALGKFLERPMMKEAKEFKQLLLSKDLINKSTDFSKIPIEDAHYINETLNEIWTGADEATRNRLGVIKSTFAPQFDQAISKIPELKDLREAAKNFYSRTEKRYLHNQILDTVRTKLAEKPSAVQEYLNIATGDPGEIYDKLMALKKGMYVSAAVPASTTKAGELVRGEGLRMVQRYNEDILMPLRYQFIATFHNKSGVFEPDAFLDRIKTIKNKNEPLLYQLWGGQKTIDNMVDFATTLSHLEKKVEPSIFIQLAQAGAVSNVITGVAGATVGGALGAATGNDPVMTSAVLGATGLVIGPYALARVFTSPRKIRMLNDGIKEGPRSIKLARALREIGAMKTGDMIFKTGVPEVVQTYSTLPTNEEDIREQPGMFD